MNTINIQPVEKQVDPEAPLQVHSIFYTIQGEGPFAGKPAVFVRLAGCNLQCPLCDTDYTSKRMNLAPSLVLEMIDASCEQSMPKRDTLFNTPLVVITGGEPFRQNIDKLVRLLVSRGHKVQIETNGTLHQPNLPWDSITVVCSPKTGKLNPKLIPHIDAYKYVMKAGDVGEDGLPLHALDHSASPMVARPPRHNMRPVYLQPADVGTDNGNDQSAVFQNKLNLEACIDSCMRHGYTLQLQIHKIINME